MIIQGCSGGFEVGKWENAKLRLGSRSRHHLLAMIIVIAESRYFSAISQYSIVRQYFTPHSTITKNLKYSSPTPCFLDNNIKEKCSKMRDRSFDTDYSFASARYAETRDRVGLCLEDHGSTRTTRGGPK